MFQHKQNLFLSKLVTKSFTRNANKLSTRLSLIVQSLTFSVYHTWRWWHIHCGTTPGADDTLRTYVHLLLWRRHKIVYYTRHKVSSTANSNALFLPRLGLALPLLTGFFSEQTESDSSTWHSCIIWSSCSRLQKEIYCTINHHSYSSVATQPPCGW